MLINVHHGKNIRKFRDWFGMKQEVLAHKLGDDWTQSKVSLLENKETIEPEILENVARALGIKTEALETLDADTPPAPGNGNGKGNNCDLNFNPIDKIVELYERIVKAKDEQINAYRQSNN